MTNHEERSRRISETFNDVAREGGAVRLVGRAGGEINAIPTSLQGVFGSQAGTYVTVESPTVQKAFNATQFERIETIGFVHNVRIVDPNGRVVRELLPVLAGCRCQFEVWSLPRGDVYRVEVAPDQTFGAVKEIPQIHAGAHIHAVQHFEVALEGAARKDYVISIHKVDAATAKRDRNATSPKLWEETFTVAAP